MITKEKLQEVIDIMPNEIDSEDIIDKIILLNKIEKGMQQSLVGETYSTEEAMQKLKKWLQ